MMQWTPLAQAKNVGAHFDLTLAKERGRVVGGGGMKNNGLLYVIMMQQFLMHYTVFYDSINLGPGAQRKGGTYL